MYATVFDSAQISFNFLYIACSKQRYDLIVSNYGILRLLIPKLNVKSTLNRLSYGVLDSLLSARIQYFSHRSIFFFFFFSIRSGQNRDVLLVRLSQLVSVVDDFYAIMRQRSTSMLKRTKGSLNSILSVLTSKLDNPFIIHWTVLHLCRCLYIVN